MNRTFLPQKSRGGLYLIITLGGIVALFSCILLFTFPTLTNTPFTFFILILFIVFLCVFAYFIFAFYTMKYVFATDHLLIQWGLIRRKILYENIKTMGLTSDWIYDGLRLGGIALPGYYGGKFMLLLNGIYEHITLYSSTTKNLVIIYYKQGKKLKTCGISPENPEAFLSELQKRNDQIEKTTIKTREPLESEPEDIIRNVLYSKIAFIASLAILTIGVVFFVVLFVFLPPIVPVHFDVYGVPNRWGSKLELIGVLILLIVVGLGFTLPLYILTRTKTELLKSSNGYKLMLVALGINLALVIPTIATLLLTLIAV
ncbi:MAG: PH domain-containing protein [Candidatus Helarchaeota archaeon]